MPVKTLDALPVMGALPPLRDVAAERRDELSQKAWATEFLGLTAELDEVSARIGELDPDDDRLPALRDLAHARCAAARTTGDTGTLRIAAELLATLALSTADPALLATARLHLAESALADGDRETAEQLALSVRLAEKNLSGKKKGRTGEQGEAEALLEQIRTPVDPLAVLRDHSRTADHADLWNKVVTDTRQQLRQAETPADLAAVRDRLQELWEILVHDPAVVARAPQVSHLLWATSVHRMTEQVLTALDDPDAVADVRARFFREILARGPEELPAGVPVGVRVLAARLHVDLPTEVTGHDDEDRLFYAGKLVDLQREAGDAGATVTAMLDLGDRQGAAGALKEMYDTYVAALAAARDAEDTVGTARSTVRLASAQFGAGNRVTAADLLLDIDRELSADPSVARTPATAGALAEVKATLAQLYGVAGPEHAATRDAFLVAAADLFTVAGDTDRAGECRAAVSH